jgi:GMP synthase-like glutamine amidotransferase
VIYVLRQWKGGSITGPRWHLERNRIPYRIIEAYECPQYPELKKGDAIIGLGGPPSVCNMHDPDYEHEFILYEAGFLGYAIVENIPFFGICLSHQLRAKMDNNPVVKASYEFGIQHVRLNKEGRKHWLFKGMPETLAVYQHHTDHVLSVNSGARLLGESDHCGVEIVAWDDHSVSTQFHPEVLLQDVPDALGKYPESLKKTGTTVEQHLGRLPATYMEYVTRMFDNFFCRAGYKV